MSKHKTEKSLLNVAMDLMKDGFEKLNQAMEYLEQEEEIRKESTERITRAFASMPTGAKARRASREGASTPNRKKRNGAGRPPAEWASHALNFLERERKCNELEGLLRDIGYPVHPKTLNQFLIRKMNEGVLVRVAMGHYQMSPKEMWRRKVAQR